MTPHIQLLSDCRDKALAGGKAVNLGVLLRAGFIVPDGFCVTTQAYRYWASTRLEEIPQDLTDQIVQAYRDMGSPPVAVRSSATAEDMSEASMAGQYDTFLDIADEASLLNRVRCCWASLDSPRTRSYLKEHGIELSQVAMAVVVQRLVPSDVSGVLFTANPQTGSKSEMLIEASWGLGESVVSGLVQPDVLRIDRAVGRVISSRVADKQVMIPPGSHEEVPVAEEKRRVPCLKGADVAALWKLGLQTSNHFGGPQDIEWGIHNGKLYLLQSRPITTLAEAEAYEETLTATRAQLREMISRARGPWVVHNIGETLPHPTPLTWSVIRRFMSGDGGFGAMYRQAGFEPSPTVCREGFLTLIAGKIYMDTSLAPEMFFENFPFRYDLDSLRRNPDAAQSPPTIPTGSFGARIKMARKAGAAGAIVHALADHFHTDLTQTIIPQFVAWAKAEKLKPLVNLTNEQLTELWHEREKKVMLEFAPQSLLPSLISGAALGELKTFLEENFWDDDAETLATLLSSAHAPDNTVQSNIRLYEVANNEQLASEWLAQYGHRAPEEFDLATPRWHERPEELLQMARRLKGGSNPADIHAHHLQKCEAKLAELKSKLEPADQKVLETKVALARRYMPFREDGKYYLMLGYELLRQVALEIGRRLEIGPDVFLLNQEEMFDALNIGFAPQHLIANRKIARRAEKRVPLPYVIDESNIEDIGAPPKISSDGAMPAFAISPGAADGPARIVRSPAEAGDLGQRYILVCPSTDPSWTPLFTNAAGLILECGGTLSHGAVVAREMSIPAVVLRDACTILKDGARVSVDGRNGSVSIVPSKPTQTAVNGDTALPTETTPAKPKDDDTRLDRHLIPPPPGAKERASARLRNFFFLFWGVYLLLAFLLPEDWLYNPSLRLLDVFLWPIIRTFGKPGGVAIISALLGAATMFGQKFLTDNHRLYVAKTRSAALMKEALDYPAGSPRASAMEQYAGPVQMRVLLASFVPLAVLLGPMVMIFFWFPPRVDIASWNAPPGTPVDVVATFNSEARNEKNTTAATLKNSITLSVPPPLVIDGPASQKAPPVREVLEERLADLRKPSDLSAYPREIRESAEAFRKLQADDLDAFLKEGIPPQTVSWKVRTPENVSGKWPVTVKFAGDSQTIDIVLGNQHPPAPAEVQPDPKSRIVSLKIIYPQSDTKKVFFAPIAHWDWGWLWVYMLAYLPAMFGFKALLKIA